MEQIRFGGIQRLYGEEGQARLARARVLVVGLGGVGSWTAEALARSGIGALTLLDGDEVCVTNVNRQLHALDGTVGQPKVEIMAERLRAVHPGCRVDAVREFFHRTTVDRHFEPEYDYVVDAIDGVLGKAWLLATCRDRGVPVVTCGGAGGRVDPTRVEVADLARTYDDPLLSHVRKKLRVRFGFPRGKKKFGIPCVFSTEPVILPSTCSEEPDPALDPDDVLDGEPLRLNCEGGLGAVSFVTGTFGFLAAARVVNDLALPKLDAPPPGPVIPPPE